MEGVDIDRVCQILRTPRQKVIEILKSESDDLEVSKSLLNILYNLVTVGSLPTNREQKVFFDSQADTVRLLLDRRRSLQSKKETLEENIDLVIAIAASCPYAVTSSSLKTATDI